ncbi:TIGR03759 family integrating conjugative element protein [Pseudomonas sp. NPDC088368]|uniref:TIGR03759 family integrating conjugative element protein n=1 Tax=Pseudomonas sp. NPDC088368 TaxID=3364453 RepID=UPI00381449C3
MPYQCINRFVFLGLIGAAAAGTCAADSTDRLSTVQNSQGAALTSETSASAEGLEWGLDRQEWQRYQALMKSPRGVYSPGLDPLTALGIEARSDEERRHYAELQVKAEAQRTAKELAYQQAYDEAWKRFYPNLLPIQSSTSVQKSTAPTARGSGRLAVFVKAECADCSLQIHRLQEQKQGFDIYMVGSQGDDARIRAWAVQAGVDPTSVQKRQITLNHDAGRWLSLGLGGELPAVVREVNGQWLRQ